MADIKKEPEIFSIPIEIQKFCLKIARDSIQSFLIKKEHPKVTLETEELHKERAVFVTLTKNGNLRGCIGTTMPQTILKKAVVQMSIAAAFEDPRFPQVTEEELKQIKIEISILSPMQKIDSHEQIIPNKHGVLIKKGFNSGLFLPQVWEHFNSKEDFMNELCTQKAGIHADSWKNPNEKAELFVFEVFNFSE
ncbi:MAG: AmmeMemoRadiSam system protein A [Candidatus Muirbacterium halophilum]|nr:AmmeMemoRadiSam system protein A [Candidatus Muirbacterium halophilum]